MEEKEMLAKAIALAAEKHYEQTRIDKTPYIYHPMKVAEMVKDAGYGIKYQVVAILHDTLEDTDVTEEEIRVFGEDILEAVKLLTRLPGTDEADYVEKILNNHMASVVKNADKINNMWDAAYCDSKKWAKKYVRKAKEYYEGKFSYALDCAIGDADAILSMHNPKRKAYFYTREEMMLNSEKVILSYSEFKKLYDKNIDNHPDFSNPNMQYWYEELLDIHFCFIDDANVWSLNQAGWLPMNENPLKESEYGDYLMKKSREEILDFIREKKEEGYFYDFVDLSLL